MEHEKILQHYQKAIEDVTGKECIILLVDTIDMLLPLLALEEISNVVSNHIESEVKDLLAVNRNRDLVNLRKIFCLLAKRAKYSYRQIGHFLRGRDPSTIIHSIAQAKDHLETEVSFVKLYHTIEADLLATYKYKLTRAEVAA